MLWLEHISPEQLQMGVAVCSLLTVMLLIVALHKINRILRYIQKKQPGTDRMESAEFGSALRAEPNFEKRPEGCNTVAVLPPTSTTRARK